MDGGSDLGWMFLEQRVMFEIYVKFECKSIFFRNLIYFGCFVSIGTAD